MSKVILTQEQADAVKKLKESIKVNHEKFRSNHQCNLADWEYVLLDIPTEKYLNAIFEGYEVAPTFKIGDWATHKLTGDIGIVDWANSESVYTDNDMVGRMKDFRHSTPEEITEEEDRRLFARHGRGVWELRKNDILYNPWLGIRTVFHIRENGKVSFSEGHKEYEIDEIKESYRVACFAEDRLDVKENE